MKTFRTINVPLGSTIRARRSDGTHDVYVFRGTDPQGPIYEDSNGARHGDIGEYQELSIKTSTGWVVI